MAVPPTSTFLLRVLFTPRILTAQVTNLSTESIIAMASTNEPEFLPQFRTAKLKPFYQPHNFYDHTTSLRIGGKLGLRLRDIGVQEVEIDVDEVNSRPLRQRRLVGPLLASLQDSGVRVLGAQGLPNLH